MARAIPQGGKCPQDGEIALASPDPRTLDFGGDSATDPNEGRPPPLLPPRACMKSA